MSLFLSASYTLLKREVVRFLRQKHRVVGALGTPLVFWFLIGSGLGRSFQSPLGAGASLDYLQYFFPGTIVLILLFTAIFSTISLIEDRREGFLQGVLVSPAPRASIAMGKILGGTVLATAQGLLMLMAVPWLGISMGWGEGALIVSMVVVLSFGLTGLGFLIAWTMDSTQGFHAIMNLFLMPMWFLSGALFPVGGAPSWLKRVMMTNPLTYGVAALHQGFFPGGDASTSFYPSLAVCWGITGLFALCMFGAATWLVTRPSKTGR